MMLQDATSYVRVQNIYNPENFDRSVRAAAEFVKQHSADHGTLPTATQIAATTGVKLQHLDEKSQWYLIKTLQACPWLIER